MFYSLYDDYLKREIYISVGDMTVTDWWKETLIDNKVYGHTLWLNDYDFDIKAHEKYREKMGRQEDIVMSLKRALRRCVAEDNFEELLQRAREEISNLT